MLIEHRNHIDFWLLIAVMILMFMSLGIVYSASAKWAEVKYGESETMLVKHAGKVILGVIALFIGMFLDYTKIQRLTKLALIVAIVLLFVTLILGGEAKGATRWLRFSSFGFQPSEFAKFALLFHLATLIAVKKDNVRDLNKGFLPMLVWIGVVTVLVMAQPNFSMGAMIFGLSFLMLFVGRARITHLLGVFLLGLVLLGAYMMSAEYRQKRIVAYLSGESVTAGHSGNYQLRQGMYGFANGGMFGVGPGESKQRDLFLPESYGDFVFAIVGEEYGFIGTAAVMGLFLLIMFRGLKIARYAEDDFGRNLALAITSTITVYAVVNAGVTLGLLPTTGLPMPFVSYGGSAMVLSAFAVGVLLNISSQTMLHPRMLDVESEEPQQPNEQAIVGKVY
jgi:cell division protein FtsW